MKKVKRLDIYIDESGDFSSFSPDNSVYSVAFILVDYNDDNTISLNKFKTRLSSLLKGDHFVHVGNLVRGEKPYEDLKREERWKLFYCLYLFAYHSKYQTIVPFIVKPDTKEEMIISVSKIILSYINQISLYLNNYTEIFLHYDFGQNILGGIIATSFSSQFSNSKVIKTSQSENPFMQVADLFAFLELLRYKMAKGYLSPSENRFFGGMKNLNKNYLKSLEDKYLIKNKKY